jgi:hypothetical protein
VHDLDRTPQQFAARVDIACPHLQAAQLVGAEFLELAGQGLGGSNPDRFRGMGPGRQAQGKGT